MGKLAGLSAFFPAYNEEGNINAICASLKNVLPQISDDYEIIVVNDGSRDRTGEFANRLAQNDDKIRVIHHEDNWLCPDFPKL